MNEIDSPRKGQGGVTTSHADALAFYTHIEETTHYFRENLSADRDAIGKVLRNLGKRGTILEIGSGRGQLQGLADEYVALDYSLYALSKFISPKHQRVCATAERLPFPDESFAFIYSVAALEHVPDAAGAFNEIHRVLEPGGMVFLAPAWHCIQDNCEGIPIRPYGELTLRQKLRKLTLPLRASLPWKAAITLPRRVLRRVLWSVKGGGETALRIGRLRPDYQRFWMSDSDAVSRLDSHEGALYFHSRGYRIASPGGATMRQLLASHQALIARKPDR